MNLYDKLYKENEAFKKWVDSAEVVENHGTKKTINESLQHKESLLDRFYIKMTELDSTNMNFIKNVSRETFKTLAILGILGIIGFIIYQKRIKKWLV